jgi:hypothetical protein
VDTLNLLRPIGEQIRLTVAHYVEDWRQGLGRYTGNFEYSLVGGDFPVLRLGPDAAGGGLATLASGDQTGWDHVTYNVWFNNQAAAGSNLFIFKVRVGGGAVGYSIRLADTGSPNIILQRNGVNVDTATYSLPLPGVETLLSVRTMPVVGGLEIAVVIDGTVVLTYTDGSPLTPGPIRYSVPPTVASTDVIWAEAIPGVPTQRTLG